jgi:hypothetical protein
MTKISQYSTDVNITGNDKWIGSDAQNFLITKNFTPNNLAIFFNENNVIDIGTSIRYRYQTLLPGEAREQGTISFETEIGPQVNFSAITTFLIAKNTLKGNTVTQYLDFLVDGKVLLSKASNINIFGYYKITSIEPWIPNTNFFVVTVDFLAGNGFISEDLDYLVSLVDKVQDIPPPVWGSITGDIEDQTDLINYISSQIIAPSLQQVTTVGNTTTDTITVAGIYSGNLYSDGYDFGISDNMDNSYNMLYQPLVGLQIANAYTSDYIYLYQDASIGFQTAAGDGNLRSDLLTNTRSWQFPDASGTIALTTDIPTLTSELTNDVPFLTQDNVVEYPNLASFPVTGVIGTIYIALNTGLFYSWSGTAYVLSSPPNTGITGVGITNYLPRFTSPTSIGNSTHSTTSQTLIVNNSNRGFIDFGSVRLSVQRVQSQIDFNCGNSDASETSFIVSDNQTGGFELRSKGELALKTGTTYTNEGLRVFSTGKLKFTQTPDTGTTSDYILLRDSSGNVKQIAYPTIPSGGVTSVGATSPITSSGGTTPVISTSMATNKLIGRSTAGVGVMEEITVGTGLSLSGGTLNATAQTVGFEQNFLLMGS